MMKLFVNKKGSVTVLMSLIMAMIMTFTLILIDASKIVSARNMVSGAGDMALKSGLTYYNSVLQDTYGIFAVSKDMDELKDNLNAYFTATLNANGLENKGLVADIVDSVMSGDTSNATFMNFKVDNFSVQGVKGSELSNVPVLKQQILEYMKYRAPAVIGYGFLEKLNIIKDLPKQQEAVEAQLNYDEKLEDIQKICEQTYESANQYQNYLDDRLILPDDIMNQVIKTSNEEYQIITRSGIVDQVLNRVDMKSIDDPPASQSNNSLSWSKENLTDTGKLRRLNQLLNEMIKGGEPEQTYLKYDTYVSYWAEYERNLPDLQSVQGQYEKEKEEFEDERDRLQEAIDDEESEEDGDASGLRDELDDLEERWGELEYWYSNDFERIKSIYDIREVTAQYRSELSTAIKTMLTKQYTKIKDVNDWAAGLKKVSDQVIKDLNKLLKSGEELDALAKTWEGKIGDMNDSDIKTGMQTEHDSKSQAVDPEKVKKTIDLVTHAQTYAKEIKEELETIQYIGYNIVRNGGEMNEGDVLTKLNGSMNLQNPLPAFPPAECLNTNSVKGLQNDYHVNQGYYKPLIEDQTNRIYNVKKQGKNEGKELPAYLYIKEDEVYKFLKRMVMSGKSDSAKKDEANKKKESFSEAASEKVEVKLPELPGSVPDVMNAGGGVSGNTSGNMNTGGSNKDVSKSLKETTKKPLLDFNFSALEDVLISGRDKLYLMTYASTMFSCYTTNLKDKKEIQGLESSLTNVAFTSDNNQLYRAEQEYILWGSSPENNVLYTKASIFGIRLLLNLGYAYTGDPELKTDTYLMAAAIAGWTGFGIPIVQKVLLAVAAAAETTYDMKKLLEGESVPFYKTTGTWVFKFRSLGEMTVEQMMGSVVESASEKLYKELNSLTEETAKTFEGVMNEYIKEITKSARDTCINAVISPIQEVILQCLSHIENETGRYKEEVESKINDCFANIRSAFESEGDNGILQQAKLAGINFVEEQYKAKLIKCIIDISQVEDLSSSAQELENMVKKFFTVISDDVTSLISEKISGSDAVKSMKDEVNNLLDDVNAKTQEKINNCLNEFLEKMGGTSTPFGNSSASGFNNVSAGTFTMNYKDYLMVFMVIRFATNNMEAKAIAHMGNLIQANAAGNPQSAYYVNNDFKLGNSYAMIQLDAKAEIKPSFINLPRFNGNRDEFTSEWYPIPYKGILGY